MSAKQNRKYIKAWENSGVRRLMLREFARALNEILNPDSIVDVGCGPAFFLEHWIEQDKKVLGLEYFAELAKKITNHPAAKYIIQSDVTGWRNSFNFPKFDLVVSLQVAEHIPFEFAGDLVRGMVAMSDSVFFSAAEPGQDGIGHINCQPMEYWTEKFVERGYVEVPKVIERWRKEIREPFNDGRSGRSIRKNIMYYVKGKK